MMRGPRRTAMAVRRPDGSVYTEASPESEPVLPWYKRTPIVRGSFQFIDSLSLGYRYLMKSADLAFEDEAEPAAEAGDGAKTDWAATLAMLIAVAAAVGLFVLLPTLLGGLVRPYVASAFAMALVEVSLKTGIFVLYIALMGRVAEIRRLFAYHGAEHKTIACYEHGEALTPENAAKYTRFHPRCGTSFILIVLVVSVLLFSAVSLENVWLRALLKLASLPLVVGISYEIIRAAGRHSNALTRAVSAPGLWLQRLTTLEPDAAMLEVAIAALTPCIPEEEDRC